MKGLEGLPVSFVARHSQDISNHMKEILLEDSFIKKYEIDVETNLLAGTDSVLKVDALTDHWIIKTEAWLDTGRDGDKNYAFRGMLGHYMGKHDVLFGEVQLYPGPMEWIVYGGWQHRFGDILEVGYKYDLWKVPIMYLHVCLLVKKLPCGMIMIGGKKKMNMDFLTRSIIT